MPVLKYQSAPGVWSPLSLVDAPTPTSQTFTASGTWIKPPGATYIVVEVQAGGGGGGGAGTAAAAQNAKGGGGGGGGYSRSTLLATAVTDTVTVTVGTGGAGGSTAGGAGGAGTASSFGAYVAANGGNAGAGGTSNATPFGVQGGAGGIGTAGDLQIQGMASGNSWGNGSLGMSGAGGNSMYGTGGYPRTTPTSAGVLSGITATGYGGGGSGGLTTAGSASGVVGGNGSDGCVIVTTYYAGSSSVAGVPAVDTGWINFGALTYGAVVSSTPGYRRINGITYLRGNVNTNSGTVLPVGTMTNLGWTLPAGFRPADTLIFGATANTTTILSGQVSSGGAIAAYVSAATAAWWSMGHVHFPADL